VQRLEQHDNEAIKQAWQKYYFLGTHPDGTKVDQHIQKLRLAEPVEVADTGSRLSEGTPRSRDRIEPAPEIQQD